MKRLLVTGSVACVLAVLAFSTLHASAAAPAPSIVTLPGTTPPQVAGAQATGMLPPDRTLDLTFTLRPRDPAALEAFVNAVSTPGAPLFRHFLTSAQFNQTFGPTAAMRQVVEQFIQGAGLRIVQEISGGLTIRAQGMVSAIASAFHVTLRTYRAADGTTFFANDRDITLPAIVASAIVGVTGLDDARHMRHAALPMRQEQVQPHASCPSASGGTVTLPQMAAVYGYPTTSVASQRLAVLELDGYATSDITTFAACYLPGVSATKVVAPRLVDVSTPITPGSGATEVELDIEVALGLVPSLGKVDVYEAPNTNAGWMDMLAAMANDNTDATISISWGGCEANNGTTWAQSEDVYFQQMVAQGQGVYVAAGDTGAYDCLPNDGSGSGDRTISTDDPGSDPNIVSVGGTTLTTSGNTYVSETTWNNYAGPGTYAATGGGVSQMWSAPTWQTSSGATQGKPNGRLEPDVTADADPNTGELIYCSVADCSPAGWYAFGGTSAAAPTWAALAAVASAQAGARVGLITPALYALLGADKGSGAAGVTVGGTTYYDYANQVNGAKPSGGAIVFHDITTGSNSFPGFATGYSAGKGYDLVSGLGSMQGGAVVNYLAGLRGGLPAPTPSPTPPGASNGAPTGVYLAAQGNDKTLWVSASTTQPSSAPFANGNWLQVDSTPFQAAPAIVSGGNSQGGTFWLAGTDTTGTVRVGTWYPAQAQFSGWTAVTGATCAGNPAATYAQQTLFVICRTPSGGLVINALNTVANTWGGWATIGGGLTTSPTLATDGTTLLILAQAPQYHNDVGDWYTLYTIGSGAITQWRRFDTTCEATPAVAYRGAGTHDFALACIAADTNSLWSNVFTVSAQSASLGWWINRGTPQGVSLHLATAVTSDQSTTTQYAGLGTNNAMYLVTAPQSGGTASTWQSLSLPGIFASSASATYYGG